MVLSSECGEALQLTHHHKEPDICHGRPWWRPSSHLFLLPFKSFAAGLVEYPSRRENHLLTFSPHTDCFWTRGTHFLVGGWIWKLLKEQQGNLWLVTVRLGHRGHSVILLSKHLALCFPAISKEEHVSIGKAHYGSFLTPPQHQKLSSAWMRKFILKQYYISVGPRLWVRRSSREDRLDVSSGGQIGAKSLRWGAWMRVYSKLIDIFWRLFIPGLWWPCLNDIIPLGEFQKSLIPLIWSSVWKCINLLNS